MDVRDSVNVTTQVQEIAQAHVSRHKEMVQALSLGARDGASDGKHLCPEAWTEEMAQGLSIRLRNSAIAHAWMQEMVQDMAQVLMPKCKR